jgi:hypothetical protein
MPVIIKEQNCSKQENHAPHLWHEDATHRVVPWLRCNGKPQEGDPLMSEAEQNKDTQGLLDGRQSTYGNVVDNAQRVANMWNGYLGIDTITAADMMMMMALYKAYRFKVTPDYSDNINDVLGYAEIVRQVQEQTGGLIHAETVKEYLEKKRVDTIVGGGYAGFATPVSHDIASEAQAAFQRDYETAAVVKGAESLTAEQVACEAQGHNGPSDTAVRCARCGAIVSTAHKPRHPYENVERDERNERQREAINMDAWLRNRCGFPITDKVRCRQHAGHSDEHTP